MNMYHTPCRWEDTPAFSLQTPDNQPRIGRVIDVHDGDTITVALPNPIALQACWPTVRINVRLVGVDSCELQDADPVLRARARAAHARTLANVLGGTPYAWQVAESACAMDAGRRRAIREALQQHVAMAQLFCGPFDKYGRLLARVAVVSDGGVGLACADLGDDLLRNSLARRLDAHGQAWSEYANRFVYIGKITNQCHDVVAAGVVAWIGDDDCSVFCKCIDLISNNGVPKVEVLAHDDDGEPEYVEDCRADPPFYVKSLQYALTVFEDEANILKTDADQFLVGKAISKIKWLLQIMPEAEFDIKIEYT